MPKFIGNILAWFLQAYVLMLMLGTLLGNRGLWTPAYWEVFGGLYVVTLVTNYITKAAMSIIKAEKILDNVIAQRRAEQRKKPVI